MKKPNFDHHKWSKLKKLDFSKVNINKWLICKKINVNMLCLYVNFISFSTSERSNQMLSLFWPVWRLSQLGYRVPQVQTVWASWSIWKTVGSLLITFPVDLFWGKLAIFQLDIKVLVLTYLNPIKGNLSIFRVLLKQIYFLPLEMMIFFKNFWEWGCYVWI